MTSPAGKAVSLKGWEVAGITDAVKKGISGLPSLDPFHDIDLLLFIPLAIEENNSETINGEQREMYLREESIDGDNSDDESGLTETEMPSMLSKLMRRWRINIYISEQTTLKIF